MNQLRAMLVIMGRALGAVGIASALGGCANTTYLVKKDGSDIVVYRPGTTFHLQSVRLRLPWVNVGHCAHQALAFTSGPLVWSVESSAFFGTYADIPNTTVDAMVRNQNGLAAIDASIPMDASCDVRLSDEAPAALRSAGRNLALLKLLVAERLPMLASEAWQDQYDYEAATQSMNILPGMRLRFEHETAIVTDTNRLVQDAHPGALAAPVYMQLASGGVDEAMGSWMPSLARMGFAARDLQNSAMRDWYSASGVGDLAAADARFWRLYVPRRLIPAQILPYTVELRSDETKDAKTVAPLVARTPSSKFDPNATADGVLNIKESLDPTPNEYGLFMLVGADTRSDMVKFITDVSRNPARPNLQDACSKLLSDRHGGCYGFRYRAIPVPEIPIVLQGEQQWVEIGTTFRDLVQGRASRRLRGYLTSPTRAVAAPSDYGTVGRVMQEQLLLDVLRTASLTRWFDGRRVAIRAIDDGALPALLDLNVQMGDEIRWQR